MKHVATLLSAALVLGLAGMASPALAGGDDYNRGYKGGYDKGYNNRDCYKCPPPRPHYDSTEVIKNTKDIDKSQVIETQSVVPSKRLIETNHLIVRENETRNIGVIQNNHTIIEKELVLTKRNVDTKTVNTVVNLVENKYNTERKRVVEEREIPGENRDITCPCDQPGYGPKKGLPAYGQGKPIDAYAKAPKYVNARY